MFDGFKHSLATIGGSQFRRQADEFTVCMIFSSSYKENLPHKTFLFIGVPILNATEIVDGKADGNLHMWRKISDGDV